LNPELVVGLLKTATRTVTISLDVGTRTVARIIGSRRTPPNLKSNKKEKAMPSHPDKEKGDNSSKEAGKGERSFLGGNSFPKALWIPSLWRI